MLGIARYASAIVIPCCWQCSLPALQPLRSIGSEIAASFGLLLVIEAFWERLGLKNTLESITQKRGCRIPYERALLAMVANRLCTPE